MLKVLSSTIRILMQLQFEISGLEGLKYIYFRLIISFSFSIKEKVFLYKSSTSLGILSISKTSLN